MRRNSIYRIYAAIVIALGSVLFFSEDLSAQDPAKRTFGSPNSLSSTFTQEADSTVSDSLNTEKLQQDSITFYTPLNQHGSVSIFDSSAYRKISKYDFRFKDYDGLYDIIKDEVPASRLPLGNYGQFDHFSFFGGSPRDVAFTFNNRPINDLEYGSYNPARFSAEFLESIEI
ncbi:MAG: Plug domain-containing protein, partial [Chlorobi bacterium]|nr:Plug domain-containing protein [Chlorobiota bacterium]